MWETVSQLPPEQKKKTVSDELFDLMVMYYLLGVQEVSEEAGEYREYIAGASPEDLKYETSELYEALYKPIAGENFEQRVSKRVDEGTLDEETLARIVETECHRMNETGKYDTAQHYKERGRIGEKTWDTMKDDVVRPTHWYIDEITVPIEERFYTYDGDSARYPGDFERAENNVNCRCRLRYKFR